MILQNHIHSLMCHFDSKGKAVLQLIRRRGENIAHLLAQRINDKPVILVHYWKIQLL